MSQSDFATFVRRYEGGHTDAIWCCVVSDRGIVFSSSKDSNIVAWDLSGKKICVLKGHTTYVLAMFVDNTNNVLYSAGNDSKIISWDLNEYKKLKEYVGHSGYVWGVSVHNGILYSGSADKTCRAWDIETCQMIKEFTGHTSYIRHIIIHKDKLYSASEDKQIREWNLSTGECTRIFTGHSKYVFNLHAIGNVLYSASNDKTVKSWDLTTGSCLKTYSGHTNEVKCVCTDVTNTYLFTGSYSSEIIIYNTKTGEKIKSLNEHQEAVYGLFIFGDSLFSASWDKTLIEWNIGNISLLEDLHNYSEMLEFAKFKVNSLENREILIHLPLLKCRLGEAIKDKTNEEIKKIFSHKTSTEIITFLTWVYEGKRGNEDEWYMTLSILKELGLNERQSIEKSFKFGITKDLSSWYKDEDSKNFTILVLDPDCEDEDEYDEIPVHKTILELRSSLFRDMFINIKDSSMECKDASGISIDSLEVLIEFFYQDKIIINADSDVDSIISELANAIEYYGLNPNSKLKSELERIKQLNLD
ncbi:lissencephaly-1 [Anaeramoeba flamelloides]|uniref:Lissencephaly-1 n=1 Tax=Anaeramoeba flamelloides TaxID=1746091 RepID=A0ABQ8X3H1_9EUKA|nr:lissencephaly-1 [Anaeramoeba flamelloides]